MFPFPLKDNPTAIVRISVKSVLLVLDILAVALRLWARRIKRNSLAFNDYAILFALVGSLAPKDDSR